MKKIIATIGAVFAMAAALFGAAPAQAEPQTVSEHAYEDSYHAVVCGVLDVYPTMGGVSGVVKGIQNQGYSQYTAGRIVLFTVTDHCKRHGSSVLLWMQMVTNNGTTPLAKY